MNWFTRARARLNDLDRIAPRLAALNMTPEEEAWWKEERKRQRNRQLLRFHLPAALAVGAGYVVHEGWHYWGSWAHGVLSAALWFAAMAAASWRGGDRAVKVRELDARRLRQALLRDEPPAAGSAADSDREPIRLLDPLC